VRVTRNISNGLLAARNSQLETVITFPNAKINLGLHITAKRSDGFHDLETVFYPLMWKDALEIINSKEQIPNSLTATGITVSGNVEDNLCNKAYNLLKKDFSELSSVEMHLHKNIPMGAGLGGGSADGAFTLKLLNTKFNLNLSNDQLINYALQLGSDCPFFILNEPCFATGRGEKLEPVNLNLSAYKIAVVNPGIHVNTGWAFSKITPQQPKISLKEIIQQPIETWKQILKNDFEEPVFMEFPEVKKLKDDLYAAGALYSSMSGSGSTVFGIFKETPHLSFPDSYIFQIISL
jgi:4-diphosphocytidyl-2-C-methyl-D-erythritol kinase